MRCLQIDRVKLLALASEEELALMKKTQQLAEEVRSHSRCTCQLIGSTVVLQGTAAALSSCRDNVPCRPTHHLRIGKLHLTLIILQATFRVIQ